MLINDYPADFLRRFINLFITAGLLLAGLPPVVAEQPPVSRQKELLYIVQHDCGSCHGMYLDGGLGPPLNKQVLQTRSAQELFEIISYGVASTPMPPWHSILSSDDIRWIVTRLQTDHPPVIPD
jgi:cytochrome c55X